MAVTVMRYYFCSSDMGAVYKCFPKFLMRFICICITN